MCSVGAAVASLFCFPPPRRGGESGAFPASQTQRQQLNLSRFPRFNRPCPSAQFPILCCSSSQPAHDPFDSRTPTPSQEQLNTISGGFWGKWMANSAEMRAKAAKLGLAAVLAYGLFDGVTYTTFFILAFLGYEKTTGKNPAANVRALLGIVVLMWTGNNVTRPFRVAGAAALAPAINKGLKSIQKKLNLPNIVYAFAMVAGIVASLCLSVVGLLILSRWGK